MDWVTTTTLLERLRDHEDAGAWERFVERFRRPVASFAASLGLSPADAEDVAQETLVAFLASLRDGRYDRERGRLGSWLFGIAHRQALRQHRRLARPEGPPPGGTASSDAFWDGVADERAARATWDGEWERHLLGAVTERVRHEVQPATFRAFELAVLEERDAADVAAELGVPVKVVYNAKHRVLKRMRELREEHEGALGAPRDARRT